MVTQSQFCDAAIETLRQELPEHLEWIPWHDLPRLRWRDDGSTVDERVARGWLTAAALRGAPTPDETMRQHATLFDPDDAAMLATWLLDAWIAHDTTPLSVVTDERRDTLRDIATRGAELATRLGREGTDPEARYRDLMEIENNRLAPSSLPFQGLLAVVAVCANGDAILRIRGAVDQYQDTWHDQRPARCRALARMASAMDATPGR